MQKRKNIKVFILCLLSLALVGCGIGNSAGNSSKGEAVVIWHYYSGMQKDALEKLVSEFNETVGAEKGILVSAESKGNVEALATAITDSAEKKVGADKLPDIFATYTDTALSLYQNGFLADIGSYMTEEELAAYVPAFLEEGQLSEAGLQVLPVAKSTELFYLNLTDWEDFARDTGAWEGDFRTWESLAKVAEKYYQWSGGKAFFGRDAFPNYMIVGSAQLGHPIFEVKDGQMTVNLEEETMRRLWECYAVPYLKGYYGAYGRFRSDDVKTGDLIACVGSTSSVTYYPSETAKDDGSTYPIEMKAYVLPNFENTSPYAVQQGAGMAVIQSEPKKEQAAVEFLKWFTDAKQNTEFCVASGYFPVKTEANSRDNIENSLAEAGIPQGSLMYDNILLCAKAVEDGQLYTNKPFQGGITARNVLTNSLTNKLDDYRNEINLLKDQGIPEEQAWESVITEQLFFNWMEDLRRDLEAVK